MLRFLAVTASAVRGSNAWHVMRYPEQHVCSREVTASIPRMRATSSTAFSVPGYSMAAVQLRKQKILPGTGSARAHPSPPPPRAVIALPSRT